MSCELHCLSLSFVVAALRKVKPQDIVNRCSSCQQKSPPPLKMNDFRSLSLLHVSVSAVSKQKLRLKG